VRQSPASKGVNTEVEEATALEAVTRQLLCAVVNCKLCELAIALPLLVVAFCKCSINPITNPDPSFSYSYT
jgi:hypothetical protein